MNIDKKTCINIGIVTFLLYLAIHYWDGLVGLFNLFLAAAGTLINGAIIAYVLNILIRFYERHMAPNTKKKVWNAMRRPVCMALAFLTLVAVIVALIQIILPQLISCVQVLLSSLPGVLRQMYDKLMENPTIAALMVDYNLVLPATEQEWREIIERAANLLFNGAGNVVNTAVSFTTSLVGSILSLLMSLFSPSTFSSAKRHSSARAAICCTAFWVIRGWRVRCTSSQRWTIAFIIISSASAPKR